MAADTIQNIIRDNKMTNLDNFINFVNKSFGNNTFVQKGPPGKPPRPGLEWKEETKRWVRPENRGRGATKGKKRTPQWFRDMMQGRGRGVPMTSEMEQEKVEHSRGVSGAKGKK